MDTDHNGEIYGAMGGSNEHETLLPTTYAPLPWQSHPIDTVQGPQGWGAFNGPWTPRDFLSSTAMASGGSGISSSWIQGDNTVFTAPPYQTMTVFPDRSGGFVNNQLQQALGSVNGQTDGKIYSSTMSNGTSNAVASSATFLSRLRSALGGA